VYLPTLQLGKTKKKGWGSAVVVLGNVTGTSTNYEEKKSAIFHESLVASPDATNWPKRCCDT